MCSKSVAFAKTNLLPFTCESIAFSHSFPTDIYKHIGALYNRKQPAGEVYSRSPSSDTRRPQAGLTIHQARTTSTPVETCSRMNGMRPPSCIWLVLFVRIALLWISGFSPCFITLAQTASLPADKREMLGSSMGKTGFTYSVIIVRSNPHNANLFGDEARLHAYNNEAVTVQFAPPNPTCLPEECPTNAPFGASHAPGADRRVRIVHVFDMQASHHHQRAGRPFNAISVRSRKWNCSCLSAFRWSIKGSLFVDGDCTVAQMNRPHE